MNFYKLLSVLLISLYLYAVPCEAQKVFDVHIHGSSDPSAQVQQLKKGGVYKAAISTAWIQQEKYRQLSDIGLLYGLMFPCPAGKVPYSLQFCYENKSDWPDIAWVEQQVKDGRINFFGEVLSQYYGINPSDSMLLEFYSLANKYRLPIGIHTGGAGPNHGSPNFKMELGHPLLLDRLLSKFPNLKLWIMHSGDQHYKETVLIMQKYKQVYADISVISNPDIVPATAFASIIKSFVDAGLDNRLMFGSDNGDIKKVVDAVRQPDFLTNEQKENIFYKNAERFFR